MASMEAMIRRAVVPMRPKEPPRNTWLPIVAIALTRPSGLGFQAVSVPLPDRLIAAARVRDAPSTVEKSPPT